MHGAAFALLAFTASPSNLDVIEIFREPNDHPYMYANMCIRLGISYHPFINENIRLNTDAASIIDINGIVQIVKQILEQDKLKKTN
jgi:hypothetical protein